MCAYSYLVVRKGGVPLVEIVTYGPARGGGYLDSPL